mgnify:FL=1
MNKLHLSIKHTLAAALTFLLVMLSACASNEEREAQQMLQQARSALRHRLYSEARDSILSLRKKHPTAINARKQGILLLDSIELQAAADSLTKAEGNEWERLDVKRKFYERKLQEDQKRALRELQTEKK